MDVNRSTSVRLEAPGPLPCSVEPPHPAAISTYSWQEKSDIQVLLPCLREGFGAAVDGEGGQALSKALLRPGTLLSSLPLYTRL